MIGLKTKKGNTFNHLTAVIGLGFQCEMRMMAVGLQAVDFLHDIYNGVRFLCSISTFIVLKLSVIVGISEFLSIITPSVFIPKMPLYLKHFDKMLKEYNSWLHTVLVYLLPRSL